MPSVGSEYHPCAMSASRVASTVSSVMVVMSNQWHPVEASEVDASV
jgi:hypothetical protein